MAVPSNSTLFKDIRGDIGHSLRDCLMIMLRMAGLIFHKNRLVKVKLW